MRIARNIAIRVFVAAAAVARIPSAFGQAANPTVEEPGVAGPATAPNGAQGGANARLPRDTPEMVAAALKDIPAPPPGPYQESWDSIQQNYKDPEWFRDAKFGIYMHLGIFSVPAHASEWYVRYMYGGNAGVMQWH